MKSEEYVLSLSVGLERANKQFFKGDLSLNVVAC